VVRWSADALAALLGDLYVVVPTDARELRAALDGLSVRFVANPSRDEGMASSIAVGIAALPAQCDAVVIALADQPLVSRRVVELLIERWRAGGIKAVAPRYRDGRGHPVLFDRACFAELSRLRGDAGARGLLEAMGGALAHVPVDEAAPADVDTEVALDEVRRLSGATGRPASPSGA
jgi:molybdenum cofactor cytidylyltransferase